MKVLNPQYMGYNFIPPKNEGTVGSHGGMILQVFTLLSCAATFGDRSLPRSPAQDGLMTSNE